MAIMQAETANLLQRRKSTIGPYSPLFYQQPLHFVSAKDVWLHSADGTTYLDGYNNVPHVGHCNQAVVQAMYQQAQILNIHSRYITNPIIDYAEKLLSLFPQALNRVFFVNSGSEANELAIRISRQQSGHKGVLISDWSYHGNSYSLARMSTGLKSAEGLADYVRPIKIPDILSSKLTEEALLEQALAQVDEAILSLQKAGYGVSMFLFDPLFSTEGLVVPPKGYVEAVCAKVRKAGGFIVSDEVQSGFGRSGEALWGFQLYDLVPDFVTMGKPMGNGHPLGGVVTTQAILDKFGAKNEFFNTFAGNPVSSCVGQAVLFEMERLKVQDNAAELATIIMPKLQELAKNNKSIKFARGRGLFFGLEFITEQQQPDADKTRALVEIMRNKKVLISKIGRHDNVLKIRPPMVFNQQHAKLLLDTLEESLYENK